MWIAGKKIHYIDIHVCNENCIFAFVCDHLAKTCNIRWKKIRCVPHRIFLQSGVSDRGDGKSSVQENFPIAETDIGAGKKRITPYPEIPMRENQEKTNYRPSKTRKICFCSNVAFIYDSLYSQFFHVLPGAKKYKNVFLPAIWGCMLTVRKVIR